MDEKRIEAAAKELVNALDRCADVINGAFQFAAIHVADYTDAVKLIYGKELDALKRALAGEGKQASPADAEVFAQAEREFNAGETVPEASVPEAQDVVERVCEAYGRVALAAAREHDRERHDDYAALEHRADALAEAIRNFTAGCDCNKCNRARKALAAYEKGKQA